MNFLQDDIEENIDEFQFNSLDEIQDSEEIRETSSFTCTSSISEINGESSSLSSKA
jgi:hypothetical protein